MTAGSTKSHIGKEDVNIQSNANAFESFKRRTTTGGEINITKFPDIWEGQGQLVVRKIIAYDENSEPIHGFGGITANAVVPISDVSGYTGEIHIADIITKGPWVDARAYATLEAANTAAYNAGKTLLIAQNYTLTANTTLTAAMAVIKGGSFTKASTYTLTINGPFEAGLYQVFSGFSAGDVTFGAGTVKEIDYSWWNSDTHPISAAPANCRIHLSTGYVYKIDETKPILIRHGGNSGEGFIHPANAKSALYVTGMHTDPPANLGGLDLANFYLAYKGDLSNMTGTLENHEVVTRLTLVTVAPTQTVIGSEVNVGTLEAGAIIFPAVYGIYSGVDMPTVGDGATITDAVSIMAVLPSAVAGNTITNSHGIKIPGGGAVSGGAITNAYSAYIGVPQAGTNRWGLFITSPGPASGDTPFEVRTEDLDTGLSARFRQSNDATNALIIGNFGGIYSVIATGKDLVFSTDQAGQDLGTERMRIKGTSFYYPNGGINIALATLEVHADNAAALVGELLPGDLYRTATGQLMIVYTP